MHNYIKLIKFYKFDKFLKFLEVVFYFKYLSVLIQLNLCWICVYHYLRLVTSRFQGFLRTSKEKKKKLFCKKCNSPTYTAQKWFWRLSLHVLHIHSCRSCCDTRMTKKIKYADLDTVQTGKCLIIIIHVLICKLMKTSYLLQEEVREVLLDSPNEQPIFQLKSMLFPRTRSRVEKNEFKYPLYFSLGYEYVLMVPQYT